MISEGCVTREAIEICEMAIGDIDFGKIWSNIEIGGCDKDVVLLEERVVIFVSKLGVNFYRALGEK